ncbi:cohesin domain-containing protein [Patescibacteria group bacterium]|nr:cohesin domain-containing protein [Patescibacteria group bacterium]
MSFRTLARYLGVFLLFVTISTAQAASLFFSPLSGTYEVGDQFSVRALISSPDQEMNAASANISFPNNKLQLLSVTKGSSIIDFWVQEPTAINQNTGASMEGVTLDGYRGGSGGLATLTFKAIAPGQATLNFISGSILANDGVGTSILNSLGSASFTIVETAVTEEPQQKEPQQTSEEPEEEALQAESGPVLIISDTHSDQEKWYSNNNPSFRWSLPRGATDVDIALSEDERASYGSSDDGEGLINGFTFEDLEDGTYYVHVIFEVNDVWGEKNSFKFNIDTEAPTAFSIEEIYRSIGEGRRASLIFESTDRMSGISHYNILIDDNFVEEWKDDGSHTYLTPKLRAGSHNVTVEVVDYAGNKTSAEFSVGIIGGVGFDGGDYAGIGVILLLILFNGFLFRRYEVLKREYEALPGAKKKEDKAMMVAKRDRRLRRELRAEFIFIKTLHGKLVNIEDQLRQANERIGKRLGSKDE